MSSMKLSGWSLHRTVHDGKGTSSYHRWRMPIFMIPIIQRTSSGMDGLRHQDPWPKQRMLSSLSYSETIRSCHHYPNDCRGKAANQVMKPVTRIYSDCSILCYIHRMNHICFLSFFFPFVSSSLLLEPSFSIPLLSTVQHSSISNSLESAFGLR